MGSGDVAVRSLATRENPQILLEYQNLILEKVARGDALEETLDLLCAGLEAMVDDVICTVMLPGDGLGSRRRSSPASFSTATDAGGRFSCADFLPARKPNGGGDVGFKTCWPSSIVVNGQLAATLEVHAAKGREPNDRERASIAASVHLATLAIERHLRVSERERLTYTDALTGLPNRARFNSLLSDIYGVRDRPWGLISVDIDDVKCVNDTFGHQAGDRLIVQVADRLARTMGCERTFRIGGDEFAIIVDDPALKSLESEAARILSQEIGMPDINRHLAFPSITLGGARSLVGDTTDDVRQHADLALYEAKEHKRGGYVEYSSDLGTAQTRRFRAVSDVSHALNEGRIGAFYQPIVRLDSEKIVGFEALSRMISSSGSIVPAKDFHEATKDAATASRLTQRMLETVAADIRHWLDQGLTIEHVGINLAAADFRGGTLIDRLTTAFGREGVPLNHVILEVTESVYIGWRDHVVADEIAALRAEGFLVALDDFGTGFASLTHLLSVPVDIIKIDKTFVDRLMPGDAGVAVVEGVLGIAEKLGIKVVAEGIERRSQADELLRLGCKLGQGFMYSKPVSPDAAPALLRSAGASDA